MRLRVLDRRSGGKRNRFVTLAFEVCKPVPRAALKVRFNRATIRHWHTPFASDHNEESHHGNCEKEDCTHGCREVVRRI